MVRLNMKLIHFNQNTWYNKGVAGGGHTLNSSFCPRVYVSLNRSGVSCNVFDLILTVLVAASVQNLGQNLLSGLVIAEGNPVSLYQTYQNETMLGPEWISAWL
jgi:hypothetical protein